MREGAVGFEDHDQSFFEVPFGFGQRSALRVDAGNFFDVGRVPLVLFEIDRGKLSNHYTVSISQVGHLVKNAQLKADG